MPRLKIFSHRYGDNTSASTRIRHDRILAAMDDIERVESYELSNVVYIQKRATQQTIEIVGWARDHRVPCVYDIDDSPGQCASADVEARIMSLANVVTVDTRAKLQLFSGFPCTDFGKKVRLVPDCVDYWDERPTYDIRPYIQTVLTFGREHSVAAATPYLLAVRNSFPDLNFRYVCESAVIGSDKFTFVPWSQESMRAELLKADIVVICHQEDMRGRLRSNNRLLACMAAGVPAICLDGGANAETLREIGRESLIFIGDRVRDRLRSISFPGQRRGISDAFQEYAWGKLSPRVVAAELRKVFEEAVNA